MHSTTRSFRSIAILLALLVCQFGCGKRRPRLPEEFNTDVLLRAAGASQGAVIKKTNKRGDSTGISRNPAFEIFGYGNFDVSLSSGSYGQFLTNYQAQVVMALTNRGASIVSYEAPPAGLDAEEGGFRYLFSTRQRHGVVRVVWSTRATNHYEMVVIFSEGRK